MAYRSSTTNTGSGTSAVGNRPTGTASGDVLVAYVATSGTGEVPTPSGWTLISRVNADAPAAGLFYRVADGSEPSTWTWTLPGYADWVIQISAYTGRNTSSPILAQSASWTRAYGTTATASVTTAATSDLVFVACVPNQTGGYSWSSGFTERQDQQGYYMLAGLADNAGAAAGTYNATATATAPAQWQRGFLVALTAAGGSPPGQVTGLSATTASSSQINLSWSAPAGADSYKIERSPTGSGSWTELVAGHTSTSYSSTGLTASTTYYYRVRATNANGDGAYSTTASATTSSGGSPPATPTGVSASVLSASSIRVSWSASAGATSYLVERSPTGSGSWSTVAAAHSASPFDDSGLSPSTTYYYRVSATNANGTSSPSSVVNATTTAAGSAQSYAASSSWRWIQVEWPTLTRHRQTTMSVTAAGGTTVFYLATSKDGITWSHFSGPVTNGRVLTAVASQAAAESAAPNITAIATNRVDLPALVEARFYRVLFRNTTHATNWREYYPRRLVQSDDLEVEAVKAVHIAAGSILADKLAATAIDGFTITGALIRTAATGARIEMGGSTLAAIDAGGIQRVTITPDGLQTYNSAGEVQAEATTATNGALMFGAGRGSLDRDAITWRAPFVSPGLLSAIRFRREDTNAQIGGLSAGMNMGGGSWINLRADSTGGEDAAWLQLEAVRSGGIGARFSLKVSSLFSPRASLDADLTIVNAGLNVGTATNAGAGQVYATATTTNTDAVVVHSILGLNSTGTASAGLGGQLRFQLGSTTTANQNAAAVNFSWANALHSSRRGRLALFAFDATTAREGLRIESSGTAPLLGFYGAGAVSRPTVTGSRGGNAALGSLLSALASMGLVVDSSS